MKNWQKLLFFFILIFYIVINDGDRVSNNVSIREARRQIEILRIREQVIIREIIKTRKHSAFHKHEYGSGRPIKWGWKYGEFEIK